MPRTANKNKDYEDRFLDMLMDRLDRQDEALKDILTQVRYTNGKVIKLRSDVDALQSAAKPQAEPPKKKNLPKLSRDPKVIQVAVYVSLAVLLLVAHFTKFNAETLLKVLS